MTLTRKDFTMIADVQRRMLEIPMTDEQRAAAIKTVQSLADMLAETNPRFDRKRFLMACGVSEGVARPDGATSDTPYIEGPKNLYEVSKEVTLKHGLPYTDPRTGVTTKPRRRKLAKF